jgi:catechol 2,3-dioxygenase-like lactoylglutathione lyase family enzyme
VQHQISVITLGVRDMPRSCRFYQDGFGWRPVFEQDDIVFYQMNGFVFGTWLESALREDSRRAELSRPGAFSLAHNVGTRDAVAPLMERLVAHGGVLLRLADEPPYGGLRGYVADPDDHTWEIAWNPAWPIDAQGHVSFRS